MSGAGPTYVVAALLVVGGAIGFVKANSAMSLIMGIISGAILCYAATLFPQRLGYNISIGFSTLLGLFMGYRFIVLSAKFMPTGLVATLSISLALYNFIIYYVL